jgi:hypothetical protein
MREFENHYTTGKQKVIKSARKPRFSKGGYIVQSADSQERSTRNIS